MYNMFHLQLQVVNVGIFVQLSCLLLQTENTMDVDIMSGYLDQIK